MERKLVKAKDLKVGMKLANGGVVTEGASSGLYTHKNKVDVWINGYPKMWHKNTEIAILID